MAHSDVQFRKRLHPGWRLVFFLLAFSVAAAGVTAFLYLAGLPKQRIEGVLQPLPLLATGLAIIGVVVGVTWLFLRFLEHRSMTTIGLPSGPSSRSGLAVGLLLGAIVPGSIAGLLWASGHAEIQAARLSSNGILHATLPMIVVTCLLSSWEEIAFRGYPLQLLNEIGGVWFGTVLTGITFGLIHGGNPGANPLGLVITGLNGILLGWVVLRTGSLWLACGYHAGWNLTAAILLGMSDSGMTSPGSLFITTLSGPTWLSGGAYGFEASVLTGIIETLVLGAMIRFAPLLPGVPAARSYFAGRVPVDLPAVTAEESPASD